MVVPSPQVADGLIARIVAEHMRTRLSQPIIVDNATGALEERAWLRPLARRPTAIRYYTERATQVVNGAVYSLQYDLINDFEPIARRATLG
jgi:tripartite-type tricarboxylate transporter receptor subunit TctC